MLLEPYRQLWVTDESESVEDRAPSRFITITLLAICIVLPITIGLVPYNPMITLTALAIVIAITGLALFYNIRVFIVFIVPFVYFISGHYSLTLVAVLLFISFLGLRLRSGDISFRIPFPLIVALILLAGLNGLSRAVRFDIGRYFLLNTILIPLFIFLIIYNLRLSTKEIRMSMIIICSLAAIIGWVSLGVNLQSDFSRQIVGWDYGTQNRGAAFLGLLFPYSLVALIDSRKERSLLLWLWIFLGILAGILATQTRAILLAIFVAAIYISWRDRRAIKVLLPVLIVAIIAVPALIITRMSMLFGQGMEVDWSSVGRVQMWLNGITFIPKYFLFGMGIDTFHSIYVTKFPFVFLRAEHVHNIYLRWLFDYGIFGLMGFSLFIFGCLRRGHRILRSINIRELDSSGNVKGWNNESRCILGLIAGLICLIVAGLTDCYLRDIRVSLLFWTMLSYLLVLSGRFVEDSAHNTD